MNQLKLPGKSRHPLRPMLPQLQLPLRPRLVLHVVAKRLHQSRPLLLKKPLPHQSQELPQPQRRSRRPPNLLLKLLLRLRPRPPRILKPAPRQKDHPGAEAGRRLNPRLPPQNKPRKEPMHLRLQKAPPPKRLMRPGVKPPPPPHLLNNQPKQCPPGRGRSVSARAAVAVEDVDGIVTAETGQSALTIRSPLLKLRPQPIRAKLRQSLKLNLQQRFRHPVPHVKSAGEAVAVIATATKIVVAGTVNARPR